MGNQSSTHGEVPIIAMKQEVEEMEQDRQAADPSEQASSDPRESDSVGSASAEASEGHQPLMKELADYRLEKKVLGEGAFAKVRLATSESTGHAVAVKIIKRKKLNQRTEELLQREVKHHERLRHANIVRLRCSIMTPTKYYLVMEYCPRGDLLQFVNTSGWLPDELARSLFRGLMDGINFCHKLGICHRDLKVRVSVRVRVRVRVRANPNPNPDPNPNPNPNPTPNPNPNPNGAQARLRLEHRPRAARRLRGRPPPLQPAHL